MNSFFILLLTITISYPAFAVISEELDSDVIGVIPKSSLNTKNSELSKLSQESKKRAQGHQLKNLDDFIKSEKKKSYLRKKLTLGLPDKYDDNYLYSEMVRSFQSRDIERLELLLAELLKQFPNSIHADNALVITGQLNISINRSAEALRQFEQVIQDYPFGNRLPAAQFGKSVAYKNLKLYKYANSALDQLKKDFPGSPEAYRAELEKRLIEAEAKGLDINKSVN
jgi:TolA-binding protein